MNHGRFKIIPGWNEQVKNFHIIARKHFLLWKEKGKPKFGKVYEDMRTSRTDFRNALNSCKANDQVNRNKRLLEKLKNKNYKEFWSDVHNIKKHNDPQITDIDGRCTHDDIANMFSTKYKSIFNKENNGENFVKNSNLFEKQRVKIFTNLFKK